MEKRPRIALDDEVKLEEFFMHMPQSVVNYLNMVDAFTHCSPMSVIEVLSKYGYSSYSETAFAKFLNPTTEAARIVFEEAFFDVLDFNVQQIKEAGTSQVRITGERLQQIKLLSAKALRGYHNFVQVAHDQLVFSRQHPGGDAHVTFTGPCDFNEDEGVLVIKGDPIKIRKFSEQFHSLRIIFKDRDNLDREWFYSEIAEQIDSVKQYTDKHFHNYFSSIKRKIAADTGIKDFFVTTTQSVKVNIKYLK